MSSVTRATYAPDTWLASDAGYVAWAYDHALAVNSFTLTPSGTIYTIKLRLPRSGTITNIHQVVLTVGNTLTSGQCFGALYQNGSLLAQTADQSVAWVSTGHKTMALSAPVQAVAGIVVVAFWYNGTTGPTFPRAVSSSNGITNVGMSAANSRFGTADTSITTTGPSTLGTLSAGSNALWAALS